VVKDRMDGSEKTPPKPAAKPPSEGLVTTERFDEILMRLRGVVDKLETGNLPLEDSLKFFEEGIDLCRKGASILDSAERKVEVLLSGSTETPRTAPFETPPNDAD
jgi:exodeoxyribonuclease VII small subunit